MNAAIDVSQLGKEQQFKDKKGRTVYIVVDEFNDCVAVFTDQGASIGEMQFVATDDGRDDSYHLSRMFLDETPGYTRVGIGEECLRRFREAFGATITAAENDGLRRDLGDHLTGDGPGFVARMREKGLIAPIPGESDVPDDWM